MSIKNGAALKRREDLRKHEDTIARGAAGMLFMGKALGYINRGELYTEAGFESFDDYLEQRHDMSRRTADRLIVAARVVHTLGPIGLKIKNEAMARELVPLLGEGEKMHAVITAAEARKGRLTAALIREVRTELYPEAPVIDGEVVPDRAEIEAPKTAAVTPPVVPVDDGEGVSQPDDLSASGPSTPPPADGSDVTPDEVEQYPCEACGGEIDRDQRAVGYARCSTCDPGGDHHRPELDEGGLGQCSMCHAVDLETAGMVGESQGFTDRQREDAARQLGYLEGGALSVVGAVHHFMDIECVAAEDEVGESTPRWAATIGKTTCLECLRAVVATDTPAAESSVDQVALVAPQQPGADPVPEPSVSGPAPAGQPLQSDAVEAAPPSIDRPGIDHPLDPGEARAVVGLLAAGGTPSADAGEQTAGDEVEDHSLTPDESSSTDRPVVLRASVEDMIATVDYLEIPRAEWEAWSPAERLKAAEVFAAETMNGQGGYGWGIESGAPDSDLEDVDEPTDPASRFMISADAFRTEVDALDVDAAGPLFSDDEFARLLTLYQALGERLAAINRLNGHFTP